jgi:hypothetical protein
MIGTTARERGWSRRVVVTIERAQINGIDRVVGQFE